MLRSLERPGQVAARRRVLTHDSVQAGHLLFAPDPSGNLVAYEAETGTPLWHTFIHVSNATQSYMLDAHQYILSAGGDTLYAFRLN